MAETQMTNSGYDLQRWLRCCEEEIITPLDGETIGEVPVWLNGVLIRNGPGTLKIGVSHFEHVFDASALLHRFAIKGGKVTYQCRFLNSETLKKNRKANRIVVTEFGTKSVPDPCHTIFDRVASYFDITDNAGISVHPFGDQVYAMTEVANVYKISSDTLETLDRKSLLNSLIVCHTAHPHVMKNGDVYNVGLRIVMGLLKHVIVKFPYDKKGDMFDNAEIVHTVDPRWRFNPSYMHSFGITENYFIIIEQPLALSTLNVTINLFVNRPYSEVLAWYPEHETQILLINRSTGEEIRYSIDTFFFMHIINSFEENGKLIIDVCTYKDAKIIDAMYVEAIKNISSNPDYGQWCESRPKRIEIPLDAPSQTKVEAKLIADVGIEAPRINYDVYNGRPYRYFYGIGWEVSSEYSGNIIKIDNKSGDVKTWSEFDASPSEPVFVAHPDAKDEDDGVLLSVLTWGKNDHAVTFIVLNAHDLQEIARVNFKTPSQAPKCFHGWFFPNKI